MFGKKKKVKHEKHHTDYKVSARISPCRNSISEKAGARKHRKREKMSLSRMRT